jgi:hypothetical protein
VLTVSYDEASGIVRTVAEGFTPMDELERYLEQLLLHARRSRAKRGCFLHLVDATNIAVQSRESFERIAGLAKEQGDERDSNAIVMRSSLARMQMALVPSRSRLRIFADFGEAEAWLIEQSRAARRSGAA